MRPALWYTSLKTYVKVSLHFYFRKYQSHGVENVPVNRPVLFVSNHQNAFLDALIILCSLKRSPWYLARADVFKKPLLKKILSALRIMPVYRMRDGFSSVRNNEAIFKNCAEVLAKNESLLMFGEGNHGEEWKLRPLQKGFARIAFATEELTDWKSNLCIVPVGLQYEDRDKMRSRVLVNFGKPITVSAFKENYLQHPNEGLQALINSTAKEMQQLIVHINETDNYTAIEKKLRKERKIYTDLHQQLLADQKLADEIILKKDFQIENQKYSLLVSIIKKVNPIFIYGLLNNIITFSIQKYLGKKVRDTQFKPSLNFLCALFIVPLTMLLQAGIFYWIFPDVLWSALYAVSIPLSGMWGYQLYKY